MTSRYGQDSGKLINVHADDDSRTFYAGTTGGSVYGGCFIADPSLVPGEKVHLRIRVPGSTAPFLAEGVVRWRRTDHTEDNQAGVGVAWTSTSRASVEQVNRYLDRKDRKS